jgi:XTP/dITP diphosphohydrolase
MAHFACAAALVLPSGEEYVVQGQVNGVLLSQRRGLGGFGYDPIFQPVGADLTLGEFAHGEKDKISHRGIAMRAIAPRILELL